MAASGVRKRELAVEVAHLGRQPLAVHLRQQNGRSSLDHRDRSVTENIGKPHMRRLLTQAHRMREIRVGIQLHHEVWRPASTAQASENSMKYAVGTRKRCGKWACHSHAPGSFHDGLRRTGGGAISFEAFSTSLAASCVASIASSRLSLYVSRSGPLAARSCRYGRASLICACNAFTPSRMSSCFLFPLSSTSAPSSYHPD